MHGALEGGKYLFCWCLDVASGSRDWKHRVSARPCLYMTIDRKLDDDRTTKGDVVKCAPERFDAVGSALFGGT